MLRFSHIAWILLVLALAAVFAATGNAVAFALAVAIIAAPLLCLLAVSFTRKGLGATLESPSSAQKNDDIPMKLVLHNASFMPYSRVEASLDVDNMLTGQHTPCRLRASVRPRGDTEIPVNISSGTCGRLECTLSKVVAYEPFCLFGRKCSIDASRRLSVMPMLHEAYLRNAFAAAPLSDTTDFSPFLKGQDLSEVFSLRAYEPGDELRRIHWKLSDKIDGLVVKEPSLPIDNSLLIVWDKGLYASDADPRRADAMAEVMLGVCERLAEDGMAFDVAWNDVKEGRCLREHVDGEEDIYELIGHLMSAPLGKADESCLDLYIRMFGPLVCARIIYVTAGLPDALRDAGRGRKALAVVCDDMPDVHIESDYAEVHFCCDDAAGVLADIGVV